MSHSISPPAVDVQLERFETLCKLRSFGDAVYRVALEGVTQGPLHLSMGQEAIAAGAGEVLEDGDLTYCTYRSHYHTLARGVSMESIAAELMGKAAGVCGGKGGSMHLTSVEHGVMGANPIIGAHICIANGAALSLQQRGLDRVVICFFGDGTTNIGAFHEGVNLAAVWGLPVVFVCENNFYMEYTAIGEMTPVPHPAADRAAAYGLESIVVDGNDVDVMVDTIGAAVNKARQGLGPSLIEAETYRHKGHSRNDTCPYRPDGELERWLERDPLLVQRARLEHAGVSSDRLDAIAATTWQQALDALEFAKNAEDADVSAAFTDVWADGGSSWET